LRTEDLQIEDARRFYPALEVAPLSAPVHYTFLIDMSESLEEEIREVRDAALALAKRLGARDTFSLISFDETCSLRIANTSDRTRLQEEFDRLLTLYKGPRHSLTSVEAGIKCAISHARWIGQLPDAGIDRSDVYITNAVKHFKFEERGKRRIHKKHLRPTGVRLPAATC
jgi:hypothetical protein